MSASANHTAVEFPNQNKIKDAVPGAASPAVPTYILISPSGLYLTRYTDTFGTNFSPRREHAKLFFLLSVAQANAKALGLEVLPGLRPTDPPPTPPACGSRAETAVAMLARTIVESAGNETLASFSGIQKGFRRGGRVQPSLCLFTSKFSGSTLALPILELSQRSVTDAVLASNAVFEAYAEKAATRILKRFSEKPRVVAEVAA
jgi:hypothetical protein